MKCIAVDDEKWALDLLADNIRQVPYLELVARCKNARQAAEALNDHEVDLMFIDVQMPGLNGLQFIETLPDPPMVILVTAYEQYAVKGFNISAVDYLVKPVALERFIKACDKARTLSDLQRANRMLVPEEPPSIFVNVEYNLVKIRFDDITFIEGLKDYIKIHLVSASRPVLTRMTLKSMEEKLPKGQFARIHKSFIVAI
ncbi:MAG TPA: response regulator transcription factor, partial [Chryseosolibacter sp.]|nr:response regulator transcription factor [Chryseosolibacter sp.]